MKMELPFGKRSSDQLDSSGVATSTAERTTSYHERYESDTFEGTGLKNHGGVFSIGGNVNIMASNAAKTKEDEVASTKEDDDKKKLLESLRFEEMDVRRWTIKTAHTTTCCWFLETSEYVQWKTGDPSSTANNFLWIKGKPGTGKSTLMKFLHEQLQPRAIHNENAPVLVSFFFNARGSDLEKSVSGLYRSLLVQLLGENPDLLGRLDRFRSNQEWNIEVLKAVLKEAVLHLGRRPILCLIDALDECDELQIRDMVKFLSGLVCTGQALQICFASRHYPHITVKTGLSIVLEDRDEHQNDIVTYLNDVLDIGHDNLAEQIRNQLLEKASGTFIWVVLVVDILNREYDAGDKHHLRERLQHLPSDLYDLFRNILTRDAKHQNGVILCIQWILFARRPLTPRELYFAIISGYEPRYLMDCHSDDMSDDDISKYILNKSKGLAEYTKSESPTVQFIHESVRDFLLKGNGIKKIFPQLGNNIEGQSHEALKGSCLAYTRMNILVGIQGLNPEIMADRFPFLEYACQEVLYHANQAEINGVSQGSFLSMFPHPEWLRCHNVFAKYPKSPYTSETSLLYILAEADAPALIYSRHFGQSCFDIENESRGMPIFAAIAAGNNDVIEAMLKVEASQILDGFVSNSHFQPFSPRNLRSARGFIFDRLKPPLLQLIEYGNEWMSLLFISKKKPSVNAVDARGKSALAYSAEAGYTKVVRLLIEHDAEVSIADQNGCTPLHLALSNGYPKVAELLIDSGADVSIADHDGWEPLHLASSIGYPEIAKLLIYNGADISSPDDYGWTPLHCASFNGYLEVAKLLINGGANISVADTFGRTPLYGASFHGYPKVAKLLMDSGADISIADNDGSTPLHGASFQGYPRLARLLIDNGADVSVACNDGSTPLHWASSGGSYKVAELLIDSGADMSVADDEGCTPLHRALAYGHSQTAKLLIDRGASESVLDNNGRKPFRYAFKVGQEYAESLRRYSSRDR